MPLTTKTRKQKLDFTERDKIQIHCDKDQQRLMRDLWLRKRVTRKDLPYIGDYYEEAFAEFLHRNKVPKVIPKITRQSTRIHLSPKGKEDLNSILQIARKRKQSLSVVLEELLQSYLDKPENFLGTNEYKAQKLEKIV